MEELIYCHHRKCVRDDCIRKEIYMPFNVLCRRRLFDCSEDNGFKYFLGEDSNIKTKNTDYIDRIRDILGDGDIRFYIEPFVGNSETFDKITGDFIKYGTDLDKSKIKQWIKKFPQMEKNFKAGDYKTWEKIMLDDKYSNHCVMYCEPPLDNNEFDTKGFVDIINKWSTKNRILIRCKSDNPLCEDWNKIIDIDDGWSIYESNLNI